MMDTRRGPHRPFTTYPTTSHVLHVSPDETPQQNGDVSPMTVCEMAAALCDKSRRILSTTCVRQGLYGIIFPGCCMT